MSLTIYIVDDEFYAADILKTYIQRTPGLSLSGLDTDPITALAGIDRTKPQVVFLDIDMPGISGLEMAKMLTGSTTVIFTTSYREFGPEAFSLSVSGYLLKPIAYIDFLTCIRQVMERPEVAPLLPNTGADFYVKTGTKGNLVRLTASDILFVKSDRNYVDIHLPGKVITAYLTLADLEASLPPQQFIRVHRSYLVNMDKVKAIEPGRLLLSDGAYVETGKQYKPALMDALKGKVLVSSREKDSSV